MAKTKMQRYTIKNFREQFPNEDACLAWLVSHLYPEGILCKNCATITNHHKDAGRRSYSCQDCGHHFHPTAGTIYHKSRTPLTLWFYATFLMASTRCGVAAKQLERELGVTYKTAWRMFHQIRSLLDESNNDRIGGAGTEVEVDETWVGGRGTGRKAGVPTYKTTVAGAVERGGDVVAKVVPDTKKGTLLPFIQHNVDEGTMLYTDEHGAYFGVRHYGYQHERVNHSKKKWAIGDIHTNTIEGFWSLFKGGIRGVYKGRPERQHLQSYINEYSFRYNRRHDETPMFLSFLSQVRKSDD